MLLQRPAPPPREVKGEVVLGTGMPIDEARRTTVAVAGSQILAAVGTTARIATLEDLDVGLKTRSSTRDQHFLPPYEDLLIRCAMDQIGNCALLGCRFLRASGRLQLMSHAVDDEIFFLDSLASVTVLSAN